LLDNIARRVAEARVDHRAVWHCSHTRRRRPWPRRLRGCVCRACCRDLPDWLATRASCDVGSRLGNRRVDGPHRALLRKNCARGPREAAVSVRGKRDGRIAVTKTVALTTKAGPEPVSSQRHSGRIADRGFDARPADGGLSKAKITPRHGLDRCTNPRLRTTCQPGV
jgi:hypothetical protein